MAYIHKTAGSMYIYDSAVAITIDAVDQYHALQSFTEGSLSISHGITFLASANGSITDTADNGGILRCTDGTHGLTTSQYITLTGMGDAAHVGSTKVTVIDENTFDCDDISYHSIDDTGNWQRGSSLTIDTGHGGDFHLVFGMSCLSAANNKNFKFELVKNTTDLDEFAAERKLAIQDDLGYCGGGGFITLEADDTIWFQVQGTTDDTNMTIKHANVALHKI